MAATFMYNQNTAKAYDPTASQDTGAMCSGIGYDPAEDGLSTLTSGRIGEDAAATDGASYEITYEPADA